MSSVFEEIVSRCELSPLFARQAMERAVKRSGLQPERMTRADVLVALPELERTIRTFLPGDTERVIKRLRSIAG